MVIVKIKCIFNLEIEILLIKLDRTIYNATMFQSRSRVPFPIQYIVAGLVPSCQAENQFHPSPSIRTTPPSSVQSERPIHAKASV